MPQSRDDVGFVPCTICNRSRLAPISQKDSFVCDDCSEAKRKSVSKSIQIPRQQEKLRKEEKLGKADNTDVPASSRARKALSAVVDVKNNPQSLKLRNDASEVESLNSNGVVSSLRTALDAMEGELTCPICLELFAKPVTLNEW